MIHYNVLYKYGKCTRYFWRAFYCYFILFHVSFSSVFYVAGVFNETITSLTLVRYEVIIANSALRTSLAT